MKRILIISLMIIALLFIAGCVPGTILPIFFLGRLITPLPLFALVLTSELIIVFVFYHKK